MSEADTVLHLRYGVDSLLHESIVHRFTSDGRHAIDARPGTDGHRRRRRRIPWRDTIVNVIVIILSLWVGRWVNNNIDQFWLCTIWWSILLAVVLRVIGWWRAELQWNTNILNLLLKASSLVPNAPQNGDPLLSSYRYEGLEVYREKVRAMRIKGGAAAAWPFQKMHRIHHIRVPLPTFWDDCEEGEGGGEKRTPACKNSEVEASGDALCSSDSPNEDSAGDDTDNTEKEEEEEEEEEGRGRRTRVSRGVIRNAKKTLRDGGRARARARARAGGKKTSAASAAASTTSHRRRRHSSSGIPLSSSQYRGTDEYTEMWWRVYVPFDRSVDENTRQSVQEVQHDLMAHDGCRGNDPKAPDFASRRRADTDDDNDDNDDDVSFTSKLPFQYVADDEHTLIFSNRYEEEGGLKDAASSDADRRRSRKKELQQHAAAWQQHLRSARGRSVVPLQRQALILYIHGGGWVQGCVDGWDSSCREIANATGCIVASAEYRMAPEHTFPTPVNDLLHAVREFCDPEQLRAISPHLQPGHLVVMGDSAGGNLAAVVANHLHEWTKRPSRVDLMAQCLIYPVTSYRAMCVPLRSWRDFSMGPMLVKKVMKWFWEMYLAEPAQAKFGRRRVNVRTNMGLDPRASPLEASEEQLRGGPPCLIFTAGMDLLGDEGIMYAHRLRYVNGTRSVRHVHYPDAVHGFFSAGRFLLQPMMGPELPHALEHVVEFLDNIILQNDS